MKIVVVLSRVPYPLEKGDKLRAYHQLRILSEKHDIFLFCLSDSSIHPQARAELEKFCREVHFFKLKRVLILWQLLIGLFSRKPFQVHYFYQSAAHRAIRKLITRVRPDHLYCQLIRCTEYVKHVHHIPKTLDYMDAFSKGIERRIDKASPLLRPLFRSEMRRLVAYESLIFDYFEHKTIITAQDRAAIYHPEQAQIEVIPNGVDSDYFHPIVREKKYDLIFHGNMSYPPNVDGALFIVQRVLPLLRQRGREVTLLISGTHPQPQIMALGRLPGIRVSGWVDDPREAYASARIFFAPMQIGTGLQNKLLEAMAMKLPCITSELANNALQAENGREILAAREPEEYAAHIESLLDNPQQLENLAENGYRFVRRQYDWRACTKRLDTLLIS